MSIFHFDNFEIALHFEIIDLSYSLSHDLKN